MLVNGAGWRQNRTSWADTCARGRVARGCARLLSQTKGALQATASCYFPVIYRSAGWENLKPAALVSRASTARPGTQGPHDGSPPESILRFALFYAGSRLSFHSRKSARYTRPGHEIVATPRRRAGDHGNARHRPACRRRPPSAAFSWRIRSCDRANPYAVPIQPERFRSDGAVEPLSRAQKFVRVHRVAAHPRLVMEVRAG
jgi:hypothetical protein